MSNPKPKPQTQRDRFIETTRELDCDEDEGRFNETLKRDRAEEGREPATELSGLSPSRYWRLAPNAPTMFDCSNTPTVSACPGP